MIRPYRGVFPRIHPTAFIDDSAQVIGDVEVGEESSVWMSVVHVMRQTHPTTIGDNVTVGHAAVLHGCTVEDRCLIGMGAILLNGVQLGTGSIVAADTLVVEEMKIPRHSLAMGAPGKVKRSLTDQEIADIQAYADRYVGYRLDYMGG